jgi:FAD/FMN-containing dehydrogenase
MAYITLRQASPWGRVGRSPQRVASPRFQSELPDLLGAHPGSSTLPVGLMRSYGDSVLNSAGGLVRMQGIDRFIAFDAVAGTLRAEAGASLGDIMALIVPHGFFVPVTPGTRFVTLGGAIANDVHGKNHHRAGTIGRHVLRLSLLRSDGRCQIGPEHSGDLFAATIGGLGLTGIIEWAELALCRIPSSFIDVEVMPYGGLDEFWELAARSTATHEHTVAWIDCMARWRNFGRGIFSRGNWSAEGGRKPHTSKPRWRLPFDAPSRLLSRASLKLFNRLYFWSQSSKPQQKLHYASFFHPLDAIADWNRLYGRDGFWQYQCVLPPASMKEGTAALLQEISERSEGSGLAVLKTFGDVPSPGLLSFPVSGATLALDFPNRGERTLRLMSRLDAIVREGGGRLYAAKDGRMSASMWRAGYPELDRFTHYVDPRLSSDFWRRVSA